MGIGRWGLFLVGIAVGCWGVSPCLIKKSCPSFRPSTSDTSYFKSKKLEKETQKLEKEEFESGYSATTEKELEIEEQEESKIRIGGNRVISKEERER
jgi:hypothetical protein